MNASISIFLKFFVTVLKKSEILPQNGRSTMPDIINLAAAKCNGLEYFNPIFNATNAVDHNKQASTARAAI